MKRFLLLLVVVAGGLTWAALAVPTNAATVNGQSISEDQLTSDVTAIAKSADYACYLNAEVNVASQGQEGLASVDGAGVLSPDGPHTTATRQFVSYYLGIEIRNLIIQQIAAQHQVVPSTSLLSTTRTTFENQLSSFLSNSGNAQCGSLSGQQVLNSMPTWFRQNVFEQEASILGLERKLGGATTTAGLRGFFVAHRSLFDNVCITVASFTSQSDAEAAKGAVYEGGSFASIAANTSGGGSAGCPVFYSVFSQLPSNNANLQALPLNTVSDPIQVGSSQYLLLEFTSRTPTPFSSARSVVEQAATDFGSTKAQGLIDAAYAHTHVTVNPRYGAWDHATAQMTLPPEVSKTDLINGSANSASGAAGQSG